MSATIGEWLVAKAERNGDRPALEVCGVRRTYAEVERDAARAAAGLAALGLRPGETVCTMMSNSVENVATWFGLCRAGIAEVPINTAYRGELLTHLIDSSHARAIVVDADLVERVAAVADALPDLAHVVVNGSGRVTELPRRLAVHRLDELLRTGDAPPTPSLRRSDTSVILFTSGTTGPAKGVVLSHHANLSLARHVVGLMRYDRDDVLYTVFPLFHINARYTSVMAAMEADARLVMDARFSASRFWDGCRERGVTAFNYQGALLLMLAKQPERPDDAVHGVRKAFGAPCPPDLWEPFEARFGVRLVEVYGMTEIAVATQNTLEDRRIGSAGRACDHYEVAVVDEVDRPVSPGTPGEIVVRPKRPHVLFEEYYELPEATLEAFRNLWFHTGDRGRLDADGYLWFVDRMKDCIRRRGENVSSWEVEKVVDGHEAVLESAAYGVRSELAEEEVMVAVVLRPGARLTPEELLDHCQPRMAHFAVPRYVRFVDELPKTPSQRIRKFVLREDGVTADTWDREESGYVVRR